MALPLVSWRDVRLVVEDVGENCGCGFKLEECSSITVCSYRSEKSETLIRFYRTRGS